MDFSFRASKKTFEKRGLPQKSGLNLQTIAENVVQRFYKIIVAFCLVVYGPAVIAQEVSKKIPVVTMVTPAPLIKYSVHPNWHSTPAFTVNEVNERKSRQDSVILKNHAVTASISGSLYTQQFGFFCKKELQLEKTTRVPFRFRLGSLDHCNYLENK